MGSLKTVFLSKKCQDSYMFYLTKIFIRLEESRHNMTRDWRSEIHICKLFLVSRSHQDPLENRVFDVSFPGADLKQICGGHTCQCEVVPNWHPDRLKEPSSCSMDSFWMADRVSQKNSELLNFSQQRKSSKASLDLRPRTHKQTKSTVKLSKYLGIS